MAPRKPYWVGEPPSTAKRWQGFESGAVLDLGAYGERLFRLYRRYVKQWNEIELDHSRSLAEHTHQVCGAGVVGSSDKFILLFSEERDHGWLLEFPFARGFKKYHPGASTGLNSLRSVADIKHPLIHWRGNGREQFDQWLVREESENQAKGEWTEYKA